ncbi:MAG: LysM peptidoglycan-binding domain-containing protein [Lacipirellulaceae bacterium]
MNNLTKLVSSLALVAAGFGGASLLGPPELGERLAERFLAAPPSDPQGLRPLGPNSFAPPYVPQVGATPASASVAFAPTAAVATALAPPSLVVQPVGPPDASPSGAGAQASLTEAADWFDAWPTPPGPMASAPVEPAPAEPAAFAPALAAPLAGPSVPDAGAPSWWDTASPPTLAADDAASPAPAPGWLAARDASIANAPASLPPMVAPAPVEPAAGWFDAAERVAGYPPTGAPETNLGRVEHALGRSFDVAPRPSGGTHVVTDGDTLARLAERYLGDAARAGELFELNRDRLTSPELLPIGLVLKTPPRDGAVSGDGAATFAPAPFATVSAPLPITPATGFASAGSAAPVERPLTPVGEPAQESAWHEAAEAWSADQPVMARDLSW